MNPDGHGAAARVMAIAEIIDLVLSYLTVDIGFYDQTQYSEQVATLRAAATLNRAWYRHANSHLYFSIVQSGLANLSARQLNRTLARKPHLADLVRYLKLDVDWDGCASLLVPLFHLEHLSVDLESTQSYFQPLLLDNIIFANNATISLRKLTLRFGDAYDITEIQDTLTTLIYELQTLTQLHLIGFEIQLLEIALDALCKPAELVSLKIEESESDECPLLVHESTLWESTLPSFVNLQELHVNGRVSHRILEALPASLKRATFEGCDGALAYQLFLKMPDKSWLLHLCKMPLLVMHGDEMSITCFDDQELDLPSVQTVVAAVEDANIGMQSRNAWTLEGASLDVLQAEICEIIEKRQSLPVDDEDE